MEGLIESLQTALKNNANVSQENANLLAMLKEQKSRLESESEALASCKDKLSRLELHAYFSQERQVVFDLGYKQGKFRYSNNAGRPPASSRSWSARTVPR